MTVMHRIRIYHATLACLALLSYLTGELGLIHAWLGYAVAIVILLRLLWALSGERHVGLMRFYPSFGGLHINNALTHPSISKCLMLSIGLSLILTTATGIALDQGASIGLKNPSIVSEAHADDEENEHHDFLTRALEESHELCATLMLVCVGLHVTYLILFKTSLARFMLFLPKK